MAAAFAVSLFVHRMTPGGLDIPGSLVGLPRLHDATARLLERGLEKPWPSPTSR